MIVRDTDHEVRYCVGRLLGLWSDGEAASMVDIREYRTLAKAEARQAEIVAEGDVAVMQVGVTTWLPPEAAGELMAKLQHEGATWR